MEDGTVSFDEMIRKAVPVAQAMLVAGRARLSGPLYLMLAFELARRALMRECREGLTPELFEAFERDLERLVDTLDTGETLAKALRDHGLGVTGSGGQA